MMDDWNALRAAVERYHQEQNKREEAETTLAEFRAQYDVTDEQEGDDA